MDIEITGHGMELTEAMRDHVHNKFHRLTKHISSPVNVVVTLRSDQPTMQAEALVHVNKNHVFAEARDHDMYIAIDAMVAKIEKQLDRLKEKKVSRKRHPKTP